MKQGIRKFLGKKLCEYNNEMQGSHTLHQLLEDICSSHSIITMSQNDRVFSVCSSQANEAYHIIVDAIWHIKLFEEEKIIQFYEQAIPTKEFKNISTKLDGKVMGDCVKISGDVAEYISNHDKLCIWIHPDIESLVKNNFVKAELAEAKRQTKWAIVAVIISIFALLASIITPFYLDDTTCDVAVVEAYAPIKPFYQIRIFGREFTPNTRCTIGNHLP